MTGHGNFRMMQRAICNYSSNCKKKFNKKQRKRLSKKTNEAYSSILDDPIVIGFDKNKTKYVYGDYNGRFYKLIIKNKMLITTYEVDLSNELKKYPNIGLIKEIVY